MCEERLWCVSVGGSVLGCVLVCESFVFCVLFDVWCVVSYSFSLFSLSVFFFLSFV